MVLDLVGLTFAFSAGIYSLLSPCGYALLPGYISYYLGSELPTRKAIPGGFVCTLGLITVFSVIGVLASSLGALLYPLIPMLELMAGVIVIFMGVSILMKVSLPSLPMPVKIAKRKGFIGLYTFGIAYGLAAVGCSAPIFLSVLFYAMTQGFVNGIVTFLVYAMGMGLPLILTSVLVAKMREVMIKKIANGTPWLQKISGVALILVGIYLFYFYYSTYAAI